MATDTNHAIENAQAWLETITAMIKALENNEEYEGQPADEAITESPLSVEVRSGWVSNYQDRMIPAEYCILLTTGGPALRIVGELDQYGEPETARLEWQDWGTQWTTEGIWSVQRNAEQVLLSYAHQFYYGG